MPLAAALALSGCATTSAGIEAEPVVATYTSTNAPTVVARCLQEAMPGLDIELGDHQVSVSNRNQFGSILMNWLIKETSSGSTIELRKTNSIAPGREKATACF
jgi:hypothetical protein